MNALFVLSLILSTLSLNVNAFNFTTAGVKDVHEAITSGRMTCRQIIQGYLNRINAFDQMGPSLHAMITINPKAIMEAIQLDSHYAMSKNLVGILHCAPLIVKDNIDVAGLPTTAGLYAFKYMVPQIDAEAVKNAKRAGVIVLGKANMSPLADKEAWGHSETGGMVRNPYNPNRTTYGSSGGNGAAGAAMYTILGFGSETGVSVNLPSSAANLVGMRPPVALLSQQGVFPNSGPQDVVGPIAKRVEDVALLLDAMMGMTTKKFSSPRVLQEDGLRGARMNIFKMFAYDEFDVPGANYYKVDPEIVSLFNAMVSNMVSQGALITNKTVETMVAMQAVGTMRQTDTGSCKMRWRDAYLSDFQRYGVGAPYCCIAHVIDSNLLPPYYQEGFERDFNMSMEGDCDTEMYDYMNARDQFISGVLKPLLANVDVAFWPAMPVFPPSLNDDALKRDWGSKTAPPVNLIMAGSWSAYPTINVPMGFSKPTKDDPDGLPIGAIFISKPENVKMLLKVAYAYQKKFGIMKTPSATPELMMQGESMSHMMMMRELMQYSNNN